MEKRKYSVIVFDLGNVLIPFDYDIIIRRLNEIDVGLGDKFYTLYKDNYHIYRQFEKWELTTEEFIEIVLNWLDR
ncbi:MAG: HAD family phosphatase, partial [Melioribacteraceae bacterium]|nr:HAD family phosphatase [Melioribacteraceae bacterium]